MPKVSMKLARSAKVRALELLADLPGLVGIGITKIDDDYAVKVNVEADPPRKHRVPKSIGGVAVAVEVVGRVKTR